MSKDPTPRADALRQQREARYGHLQATAEEKPSYVDKRGHVRNGVAPVPKKKLIPFAGKETKGIVPVERKQAPRKRVRKAKP